MAITDPRTDVSFVVDRIRPRAIYTRAGVGQRGFNALVASWADPRAVPTDVEVNVDWAAFLASGDVATDTALDRQVNTKLIAAGFTQAEADRLVGRT